MLLLEYKVVMKLFDLYPYPYSTWSNLYWRCRADLDLVFSKSHLSDFVAIALHLKQTWACEQHRVIWYSRRGVVVTIHDPGMVFKCHKGMNETMMLNTEQVRDTEWGNKCTREGKLIERWVKKTTRWIDQTSRTLIYACCTLFHL